MSTEDQTEGSRRDFLYYATAGAGAVMTGAAVWPLINQMNPSADVLALAEIDVDVSSLSPGMQLTVLWQGKPVFVKMRTEKEIAEARELTEDSIDSLIDPDANNPGLGKVPATDENRAMTEDGVWLVQMGACTHLGCVPLADAGDFHGWFCPCHGSHYDTAGRIRKGPAPRNLPIPPAQFVSDTVIRIG